MQDVREEQNQAVAPGTVFRTLSVDREIVQWESYLDELTPVQRGETVWFKREDWFAPLGYGGINGSKLRQCIWLLQRASERGFKGVLSAGSVKSPQHAMVALVAKHYGLPSMHVLGATTAESSIKHESVRIAAEAGAQFDFIPAAYNASLQARVRQLSEGMMWDEETKYRDYYVLEYAISLDHKRAHRGQVYEFHDLGANQVSNLPQEMDTLLMPAGSCNSACSVLLGIKDKIKRPLDIHLIGIGHNRMEWLIERLAILGVHIRNGYILGDGVSHAVTYHDLVDTGYTEYQQMWVESLDGIVGHRTYEAKCFRWLKNVRPDLLRPTALFWIVGSEPAYAAMETNLD